MSRLKPHFHDAGPNLGKGLTFSEIALGRIEELKD